MDIAAAIEGGDLDELQRVIESCCTNRDWEGLLEVRDRAARAFERGRQLWPTAASAEYRLALEAPAPHAAAVLTEGTGRFALGPLGEVAASTHSWADLAPHVEWGPVAVVTMHECIARGEDCSDYTVPGPAVLDLPRRLATWEPEYPVASYFADRVEAPAPASPAFASTTLPQGEAPALSAHDDVTEALSALVSAWTVSSEGRSSVTARRGSALDAIAALDVTSARVATVDVTDAAAAMAWAAASGGALGRRRGLAAGRFDTWWVLATAAGLEIEDVEPERLGDEAARLEWMLWDRDEPSVGWGLRVAVCDPERELAWALEAVDHPTTGTVGP